MAELFASTAASDAESDGEVKPLATGSEGSTEPVASAAAPDPPVVAESEKASVSSTTESRTKSSPTSVAGGLVRQIQSYIGVVEKDLERPYVPPPVPDILSGHRGPVARFLDRIRRRKGRHVPTPSQVKDRSRRSIRRQLMGLGGGVVLSGVTLRLWGIGGLHHAHWSSGWTDRQRCRDFRKGLIREKAMQRYLAQLELSKINFAVRRAKLRAELRRMKRRQDQLEDWTSMVSFLVHRPWRNASLSVGSDLPGWHHPEGVFVGTAVLDDHGRERMQIQFARQIFTQGWLGRRFQAVLDHAVEVREDTLFAGKGSLGSPESDDSPDRNGFRSQVRTEVTAYFDSRDVDPLLLQETEHFISGQPIDGMVTSIDVSGESTGTGAVPSDPELSVSSFFGVVTSPSEGQMPPGLWSDRGPEVTTVDRSIVFGKVSADVLIPRVRDGQLEAAPPRLVITRLDISNRATSDLASGGDGWLHREDVDDDALGGGEFTLSGIARPSISAPAEEEPVGVQGEENPSGPNAYRSSGNDESGVRDGRPS